MSKFGLGKGLSELKTEMGETPEISVLAGAERVVVRQIPIEQIGANPNQPRKTFTAVELEDLANSIREKGVLQPILVRAVFDRPFSYEIVAGERRWRASKIAGLKEIPALVKTVSPKSAMEIALIENVQRENLNAIEEAAAYHNLMDKLGYELADVSKLIGKSVSYIRNIMRLDALPDSVKKLVEQGELSASHARTISVAANAEFLAKEIISEKLSVAETEARVKAAPRKTAIRAAKAASLMGRDFAARYERRIEDSLKVRAYLKAKTGGAGELTLYFNNKLQMEQLVALLEQAGRK